MPSTYQRRAMAGSLGVARPVTVMSAIAFPLPLRASSLPIRQVIPPPVKRAMGKRAPAWHPALFKIVALPVANVLLLVVLLTQPIFGAWPCDER